MEINGGIERCTASPVRQVRICAFLDQYTSHVIVTVDDGRKKRSNAVLIGAIDFGAAFQKYRNAIDAAIASRKFQSGQTSQRKPFLAGLSRVLSFPLVH